MSARANRRRLQTQAKVKLAFGGDDDDDNNNNGNEKQTNPELLEENDTASSNQNLDRHNTDANGEKSYDRAFFTVENKTVEVIFDNNILRWSDVTGSRDETNRRISTNRDEASSVDLHNVYAITPIHTHWNWSLNVNENIAGTTVSTSNTISSPGNPSSSALSANSALRGFQLHSYHSLPDNVLEEILIIFQSDDPTLIERWFHFLSKTLARLTRIRHVFVLCNPYAGSRRTRHVYDTKIKPMLERALYKITYTEIDDHCGADEALSNLEGDFDAIDSLVVIGGDGSVINVINALIRYVARQNRIRLDMKSDLPSIPFPICIIPDGTTNIICHTIHGNVDHYTPVFHLLFNQKMKIDMSAIFDIDCQFVTANFGASAGYPAGVLKYFPRYSFHSPKTVLKKSFAKAISKKNLQPVEMEIRYIPAMQNNSVVNRCYRGCSLCTPVVVEKSDDQVKAFDNSHLQEITRRRKSLSNTDNNNRQLSASRRSYNQQNDDEKNWKILHRSYTQVAVYTNPNLWTYAPQGLSKFGHIGDGLLDLVLIDPVKQKEFLRYVKRNGNSKNQHELPFTNIIKVKEIEIELKVSLDNVNNDITNTDNQYDSTPSGNSSNDDMSDNENNTSALHRHQPHPPSIPISENSRRHRRHHLQLNNQQTQESTRYGLETSISVDASTSHSRRRRQSQQQQQQSENETDSPQADSYGSTTARRRSGIFQSLKLKKNKIPLPRPLSARGEEPADEKQQKKNRKTMGGTLRPARSLLNLLSAGNLPSGKTDKSTADASRNSSSAGFGRKSSAISRSSSVDNNKASDANNSNGRNKRPCLWNLDFTPYNSPLLRIKCFCRYLPVYGVGLSPDTRLKETTYSCF